MTVVLHEQAEAACPSARVEGDALWLSVDDLARATGWQLKPEGLCKGDICIPLSASRRTQITRGGEVDAAGLWRMLGHPVVHDVSATAWVLGTGADQRSGALARLEAPDFTLPDLAGVPHTLSSYRGKRVLVVSFASW